ncbi:MAG: hypothetical protein R2810_09275 [Flavobacteriales bacterium]
MAPCSGSRSGTALLPDGVAYKGVVKRINTPVADRIRTILVNMERLRWVPEVQPPNDPW